MACSKYSRDVDVRIELDRTTREFYPALSELVPLYDIVGGRREKTLPIDTADVVTIEPRKDDMVRVDQPPVEFIAPAAEFEAELEDLLATVFSWKDEASTGAERREGLEAIQSWISDRGSDLDVESLYERFVDRE